MTPRLNGNPKALRCPINAGRFILQWRHRQKMGSQKFGSDDANIELL